MGIVILVVILVGGIWWWRRAHAPQDEEAEIVTAEVTRGDLRVAVAATGVLEPLTTVEVKSRRRIRKAFVDVGDGRGRSVIGSSTRPGCRVRWIRRHAWAASAQWTQRSTRGRRRPRRAPGIEARRARRSGRDSAGAPARGDAHLTNRSAGTGGPRSARARLAQAVRTGGDRTDAGGAGPRRRRPERARQTREVLEAGARPQEIAQAQARVDEAQVVVNNARVELDRQRNLLTKGFVSQQTVDTAQRTYDTALAQLTSAREALSLLRAGARAEEIERARAAVRQAEAALEAAQAGSVSLRVRSADREAAEAAVKQAEATLATARAGRQQVKCARAMWRRRSAPSIRPRRRWIAPTRGP